MRIHRFYGDVQPSQGSFTVTENELIHQWKNVFRFRSGDRIVLFSGDGHEYLVEFLILEKKHASLTVVEKRSALMRTRNLTLYPALIKKDNLEWILQKCTELGVSKFIPILTERSEKKNFNRERAQKILVEATEQSGWGAIPELGKLESLEDIVSKKENLIAFDGSGAAFNAQDFKTKINSLGVLIGPEGGFSQNELELFKKNSIPTYSLGKQTLRAETAAVAIASLLLL